MDVRFYNGNFELIHIEPLYKSISWELAFNGMGTFEMCLPPESKLSHIAIDGEFLVAYQKERMAIITSRHFEDGKTVLYGRTPNFLLGKRVVFPFAAEGKDAVEKVEELVKAAFPDVVFESDVESAGECTYYAERAQTLLKTVSGILEEKGLGHSFTYDLKRKQWVFKIIKGRENGLLFSESLLNMYAFEKTDSILESANCGYYLQKAKYRGTWDAAGNVPYLTENPSNVGDVYYVSGRGTRFGTEWSIGNYIVCCSQDGKFSKFEAQPEEFYVFVGENKEGAERFETFLDADNFEDAKKSLEKVKAETEVVAKVKNVAFEKDYFLGDKVVLRKKAGEKIISKKMKITGVSIWQENADEGEMPLFTGEEE